MHPDSTIPVCAWQPPLREAATWPACGRVTGDFDEGLRRQRPGKFFEKNGTRLGAETTPSLGESQRDIAVGRHPIPNVYGRQISSTILTPSSVSLARSP